MRKTNAKFYTLKPLFWSDGPVKMLGIWLHPDIKVIQSENFTRILQKIKSILASWTHRILSLPGKITVVNTMISSLLIHKFMALPTPDQSFFKQYKSIIMDFLWDGKIPKIRYSKLIQDYQNGGLKLVDVEAKNHALKAAWISRWIHAGTFEKLGWLYVNLPVKDTRIWECNLNPKDIDKLGHNCKLDMGWQILKSWSYFHYSTDMDFRMKENTPIWGNSMIRHADQPIFDSRLINSNINTIADI